MYLNQFLSKHGVPGAMAILHVMFDTVFHIQNSTTKKL